MSELPKRLNKRYNITFHLHQFRAGYVNDIYNACNDIAMTSKAVGHEDIKTTAKYYLSITSKQLEATEQKHPSFRKKEKKTNKQNIDIQYIKDNLPEIMNILKNLEDR